MVPPESSSSSSPSKHAGLTSKTMVDLPTGAAFFLACASAFLRAAISCGVSFGLASSSSSSSSPNRSQSSSSSAAAALAGAAAAGAADDAAPGRLARCATLKEETWQYHLAAYGNFSPHGQHPRALNSVMSACDGTKPPM